MPPIQSHTVRRLHADDLPAVLSLQTRVLDHLGPNQDVIHPKTEARFNHILSHRHHRMIGCIESGKLVAQATLLMPDATEPDPDLLDLPPPGPPETLSTLTSVMRDPGHAGGRYMESLVGFWLETMRTQGRRHALAIVTRHNVASWRNLVRQGVHAVGVADDPSDNSTVYILHRDLEAPPPRLTTAFNEAALSLQPACPVNHLRDLFAAGYVGVACCTRQPGNLVMVPRHP